MSCLVIEALSFHSLTFIPNTDADIWPGDALEKLQKDSTSSYARAQPREILAVLPLPKESEKPHVYYHVRGATESLPQGKSSTLRRRWVSRGQCLSWLLRLPTLPYRKAGPSPHIGLDSEDTHTCSRETQGRCGDFWLFHMVCGWRAPCLRSLLDQPCLLFSSLLQEHTGQ